MKALERVMNEGELLMEKSGSIGTGAEEDNWGARRRVLAREMMVDQNHKL